MSSSVTVGLVLSRANDPTALLSGSWAERQMALADQSTIWSTYGADQTTYANTYNALSTILGSAQPMLNAAGNGYVSSAAIRTIWLDLSMSQFGTLFSTELRTTASTPGASRTRSAAATATTRPGGAARLHQRLRQRLADLTDGARRPQPTGRRVLQSADSHRRSGGTTQGHRHRE